MQTRSCSLSGATHRPFPVQHPYVFAVIDAAFTAGGGASAAVTLPSHVTEAALDAASGTPPAFVGAAANVNHRLSARLPPFTYVQ